MHFNLTSVLQALPIVARKQVVKSMIGGLNASIIGYVRGHIRNSKYNNISRTGETPTIDAFNEAMAEHNEFEADKQAMRDMGLVVQISAIDAAERLDKLRHGLIEILVDLKTLPSDVPLTIPDTVKFQLSRAPNINEPVLKAIAQAINTDIEILRAAKVKMHNDDRSELLDAKDQVIDMIASFSHIDVTEIDDAVAALPVFMQYRVINSLSNAVKKAGNKALESLLRFNRLESMGDIALIKGAHAELYVQLRAFAEANMVELEEYTERGGQLAEITPLS